MNKQNDFNKALMLLDRNNAEETVTLLKRLHRDAIEQDDILYALKTLCVLGEYYLSINRVGEGKVYLDKVLNLKEKDEDICDILDCEISRAGELLKSIQ